jgi:hypothetical protein
MSDAQRYYDALKRILEYASPEELREQSEEAYGLEYIEALEMAYDNIQSEARAATNGKKRPKS